MKAGKAPGPEGSIAKLAGALLARRTSDLAIAIAGAAGQAWEADDPRGDRWAMSVLHGPGVADRRGHGRGPAGASSASGCSACPRSPPSTASSPSRTSRSAPSARDAARASRPPDHTWLRSDRFRWFPRSVAQPGQPVPPHRGVERPPPRRRRRRRAGVGQLTVVRRPTSDLWTTELSIDLGGHVDHRGPAPLDQRRPDGALLLRHRARDQARAHQRPARVRPRTRPCPPPARSAGWCSPRVALPRLQPRRRRRRRLGHPDGHRRRLRARRARPARLAGAGRAEGPPPRAGDRRRRRRHRRHRGLLLRRRSTGRWLAVAVAGLALVALFCSAPRCATCPSTSCSASACGSPCSSRASTPPSPASRSGCSPRPGRSCPRSTPTASPTSCRPTSDVTAAEVREHLLPAPGVDPGHRAPPGPPAPLDELPHRPALRPRQRRRGDLAPTLGDAATAPVTVGVVAGLVVGKLLGVAGAIALVVRFGVGRLPDGDHDPPRRRAWPPSPASASPCRSSSPGWPSTAGARRPGQDRRAGRLAARRPRRRHDPARWPSDALHVRSMNGV